MKILQINVSLNTGSTGRIAEQLGEQIISEGFDSYIAYARMGAESSSVPIRIGTKIDLYRHALSTRLLDNHGFSSKQATEKLLNKLHAIKPDIIHLHNIHGYYLHVGLLFAYLKSNDIPVVWTFHDCWPFTGHCTFFDSINCQKWKTHCNNCPKKRMYPESWILDNSHNNYDRKNEVFNGVKSLHIVTPSNWLHDLVKQSFLADYPVQVIPNGIDLSTFKPLDPVENKFDKPILLGVASVWDKRKGLDDFIRLSQLLDDTYEIVLIGLSSAQIKSLPKAIKGISRTEKIDDLVAWYNRAAVFVNPTYQDNFPTTNLEALACGTPVITYDTGGSPEAIDQQTGMVVKKGDITALMKAVKTLMELGKSEYSQQCRKRAEDLFNTRDRYLEYVKLYNKIAK